MSALAAFMVPGLALWVKSGYSWGALLTLCLAIGTIFHWGRLRPDQNTVFLALAIVAMALMWGIQTDPLLGTARWDRTSKYVLAVPCLLYLMAFPPKPFALVYGVLVGCLGACAIALWQVYGERAARADGYTNAIQFGNLALLLAVLAAIFLVCLGRQTGRMFKACAVLAIVAGLWASVLSLSRGGWLALMLMLPVMLFLVQGRARKAVATMLLWLSIGVAAVAVLNLGTVHERVSLLGVEVAQYSQAGNAKTSIGQRLEHWRMALHMGHERPLFGWGDQGYKARKAELVANGEFDDFVNDFDHAHNEVLDLYAKRGVVGLLVLFLFYAVPVILFWPRRDRLKYPGANFAAADMALALRLAGVSIPLLYAGFGITQVFFAHNSGTMFYLFMVMLIWSALKQVEQQAASVLSQEPVPANPSPNAVAASAPDRKPRVLHFVTGGFSGATQVALELVEAHMASAHFQPLLVVRRKPQTNADRLERLRLKGVPLDVVAGWSHQATITQLVEVCHRFKPDLLVAHGFSDHIWGRMAGLRAGVPHMVHVEHNSKERYTPKRLQQALMLTEQTDAIVACSAGVKASLLALGFPSNKVLDIPNGVRLDTFANASSHPLPGRQPGIVMAARFARQKDHATLLHAVAQLRQRGLRPTVYLAGGGKKLNQWLVKRLCRKLDLQDQVKFLGFYSDVPGLLMSQQICVLSSHYEGMPLSLIEGMAAGCAVIGTRVPGIQEIIQHGHNGLLADHASAQSLAGGLEYLLRNPEQAAQMAAVAQQDARENYSLELMSQRYEALFGEILMGSKPYDSHAASVAEVSVQR